MARSRSDMQDIALGHFSKAARNASDRDYVNVSLEEQLNQAKKRESMTDSQKLAAKSWGDWNTYMISKLCLAKEVVVTRACWNWISMKYRGKLEEFHKKGSTYTEVAEWARTKGTEYANRLRY